MAEDRMLNDEILLGLIKANGGGGGGTTNYNQLENKPQIAGTELQGNKSLADLGIASADDVKNEFIGTLAEWNALSPAQQKAYDTYQITDDYSEALLPNYSTTEQKTGQKWIDGKDIYRKTFAASGGSYTSPIFIPHGISNIETVVNKNGSLYYGRTYHAISIDHAEPGNSVAYSIINADNIVLSYGSDYSGVNAISKYDVTLYYTKTT
jgi:hypothetical protein